MIREAVGPDMWLSVDANQKWGVEEAIAWMEQLRDFNLTWIEEPTSPDDILGHAKISRALKKHGNQSTGHHHHCTDETVMLVQVVRIPEAVPCDTLDVWLTWGQRFSALL